MTLSRTPRTGPMLKIRSRTLRSILRCARSYLRWLNPSYAYWWCKTHPTPERELRTNIHTLQDKSTNFLEVLAADFDGLPFTKWHHYLDFYEKRMGSAAEASRANRLTKPLRMLEIGVWRGGSLQLWRKYLGDSAIIFGIDIDPGCGDIEDSGGVIRIGSQDDEDFVSAIIREMGGIDIIIDDGSHLSRQVISSFLTLFPSLSEGGMYFIEDLSTSYWPSYGGGLKRPSTSIEFLKSLVDALNSAYFDSRKLAVANYFDVSTVGSVEFCDGIAAITKKKRSQPAVFYGGLHDEVYLRAWGAESIRPTSKETDQA